MNVNLTPIFEAIIALIAGLITYKLIPWIKARTTQTQQATLEAVVKTLVFAAEQLYGAGKGSEKLRYVQDQLARKGYDIDSAAIEAAVARYLNYTPQYEIVTAVDEIGEAEKETETGE